MAIDARIDDKDLDILKILQENARTSATEIARRMGMAPSAIHERLRKLEERGVVTGYVPELDARALGLGLTAYLFVKTDDPSGDLTTARALAEIPEVLEVHHVAGEDCYLVKLRTRDTLSLGQLLRERVGTISSVRSTRTTIVMETIKETTALPLATRSTP